MKIVIVGAGEAADSFSGTWLYNDYPGSSCDTPSQFCSLSHAQRSGWSCPGSSQSERFSCVDDVASEYGIDKMLSTEGTVTECNWDDPGRVWRLETTADRTGWAALEEAWRTAPQGQFDGGRAGNPANWRCSAPCCRGTTTGIVSTSHIAVTRVFDPVDVETVWPVPAAVSMEAAPNV